MSEPESELGDSQGTELSSVRSDESVTLTNEGNKIKVKDMAFELDDGTDDGTALIAYKQSLKISLAETAALEAKNDQLEATNKRLKGENRSLVFEVRVLRAAVADTCAYRRYFGRPCVVRTVHDSGFTVPTTD